MDFEGVLSKSKDTKIPESETMRPTFRCRRSEWEEFKAACDAQGIVPSKFFRAVMSDFVESTKKSP